MGSRVLGFLRDILIASVLGAGPVADAFFVAFKLPNFLRRLFAEGAFNAAFVPLFAGVLERDGRAAAKSFAEDVLTVLLWTLLVLVIAAQIVMPWLMHVSGTGLRRRAGKARSDRAAHAPHLPLHPPDLARVAARRRAELALSFRCGRGHADPAQPLPDRGLARPFALDRNAGARARDRGHGRRNRSIRLVDRCGLPRRDVAPPALAAAHAGGQAPAHPRRTGGARRRRGPDQPGRRYHHRIAAAAGLRLFSLLRRSRESASARRRRRRGRDRAIAPAQPPAAGGRGRGGGREPEPGNRDGAPAWPCRQQSRSSSSRAP